MAQRQATVPSDQRPGLERRQDERAPSDRRNKLARPNLDKADPNRAPDAGGAAPAEEREYFPPWEGTRPAWRPDRDWNHKDPRKRKRIIWLARERAVWTALCYAYRKKRAAVAAELRLQLGREPTTDELDTESITISVSLPYLMEATGLSRQSVLRALEVLDGRRVKDPELLRTHLGREPTPDELADGVHIVMAGAVTRIVRPKRDGSRINEPNTYILHRDTYLGWLYKKRPKIWDPRRKVREGGGTQIKVPGAAAGALAAIAERDFGGRKLDAIAAALAFYAEHHRIAVPTPPAQALGTDDAHGAPSPRHVPEAAPGPAGPASPSGGAAVDVLRGHVAGDAFSRRGAKDAIGEGLPPSAELALLRSFGVALDAIGHYRGKLDGWILNVLRVNPPLVPLAYPRAARLIGDSACKAARRAACSTGPDRAQLQLALEQLAEKIRLGEYGPDLPAARAFVRDQWPAVHEPLRLPTPPPYVPSPEDEPTDEELAEMRAGLLPGLGAVLLEDEDLPDVDLPEEVDLPEHEPAVADVDPPEHIEPPAPASTELLPEDKTSPSLFDQAIERTRARHTKAFELHFSQVQYEGLSAGVLSLRIPSDYARRLVSPHVLDTLVDEVSKLVGGAILLRWTLAPVEDPIVKGTASSPAAPPRRPSR